MVSVVEIDKFEYKIPVQKIIEKVVDKSIIPQFHLGIVECLLAGYPLKKIICINMKTGCVFYGRDVVETILYLKNNGIIESNLFPDLNKKTFSELHPKYQRRIMERCIDFVEWKSNDENMKYLENLYCET